MPSRLDDLQAFAFEWTVPLDRRAVRVQVAVQIAHTPLLRYALHKEGNGPG